MINYLIVHTGAVLLFGEYGIYGQIRAYKIRAYKNCISGAK